MDFDYCKAGENLHLREAMISETEVLRTLIQQKKGDPLKKIHIVENMLSNLLKQFLDENIRKNELHHIGFSQLIEWLKCVDKIFSDLHDVIEDRYQRRIEMVSRRYWSKNTLDDVMIQLFSVAGSFNKLLPKKFLAARLKIGEHFSQPILRQMGRTVIASIKTLSDSLLKIRKRDKFIDYLTNTSLVEIANNCTVSHCSICKVQRLTQVKNFVILDCCKHLFCVTCFNKPNQPYESCPTCDAAIYDHTTSTHFQEHFAEHQLGRSEPEIDVHGSAVASLEALKHAVQVRQRDKIDWMGHPVDSLQDSTDSAIDDLDDSALPNVPKTRRSPTQGQLHGLSLRTRRRERKEDGDFKGILQVPIVIMQPHDRAFLNAQAMTGNC